MIERHEAKAPAGTFVGTRDGDATVWRGIRYAEPPVGQLSWRAPVAKADDPGMVECFEYAPVCPQLPSIMVTLPDDILMGPDCLALNVWAPRERPGDEALPVMVWVHGGAYMFGASNQQEYEGAHLAAAGDVIVVSLNYRLGPFGFLDLTRCGEPGDFDANLALRDVMLALEWVKRNIAAFGGDPNRVTLFGESAGGAIVTTLLAVPSAEGLFHRAIAQSAPASSVYGPDRAFQISRRLLTALGISARDAAELRDVPTDEVLRVANDIHDRIPSEVPGTLAFVPVIDGELVPESPAEALHAGRGIPVPLIIGTNHDEAAPFRFMRTPLLPISRESIEEMLEGVQQAHPDRPVPSIDELREITEGMRLQTLGVGIARDIGFRLPALWIIEGHSRIAPSWLYRFDYATPLLVALGLGAAHATELAYVWRTLDAPSSELILALGGKRTSRSISARMSGRWAAFAHGKEPNPETEAAPVWPRYDETVRASLIIDRLDRVEHDLDASLRDGWGDGVLSFS